MNTEPDKRTDELAHAVIGAAIEVHCLLGPGYVESVYEAALGVELNLRGLSFERQKSMKVDYKGIAVGEGRFDLLVKGCLVVELKAVEAVAPIHMAQVLSYLKAMRLPLGLLINFNVPVLKHGVRRIVLTDQMKHPLLASWRLGGVDSLCEGLSSSGFTSVPSSRKPSDGQP